MTQYTSIYWYHNLLSLGVYRKITGIICLDRRLDNLTTPCTVFALLCFLYMFKIYISRKKLDRYLPGFISIFSDHLFCPPVMVSCTGSVLLRTSVFDIVKFSVISKLAFTTWLPLIQDISTAVWPYTKTWSWQGTLSHLLISITEKWIHPRLSEHKKQTQVIC